MRLWPFKIWIKYTNNKGDKGFYIFLKHSIWYVGQKVSWWETPK